MKFLRRNFLAILCAFLILGVAFNLDTITDKMARALEKNPEVVLEPPNSYKKNMDSLFVQNTTDFVPLGYHDLLNIFYTITNSGYKTFTFYCPSEYQNCLDDVGKISNDPETLTYINNFVHPFNSFSNIQTVISESGEINVTIHYLYTEEEIIKINDKVNQIYQETQVATMSDTDKIKTIHDYIINHTKYDVERNEKNNSPYTSYKATGPALEGYATCSGYTDFMALFLEKMDIPNFKVATELMQTDVSGHVWNAVFIDNQWKHLDLTWDDPVSQDGKDYLQHKYFLVSTSEMLAADSGEVLVKEHIFNKRIYPELKK